MSLAVTYPLLHASAARLAHREVELESALRAARRVELETFLPEVSDFKDAAAAESRALVEEVAGMHAASELVQVALARRRIRDGRYGFCEDCGETIDARRLLALPATRFCTECQAIHERAGRPRR